MKQGCELQKFNEKLDEINRKNESGYFSWKETVNQKKVQSAKWSSQGLCIHCGGKKGFFGSCKICKKTDAEAIQLPPKPEETSVKKTGVN